jgi:hypothetical protein
VTRDICFPRASIPNLCVKESASHLPHQVTALLLTSLLTFHIQQQTANAITDLTAYTGLRSLPPPNTLHHLTLTSSSSTTMIHVKPHHIATNGRLRR